MSNLLAQTQSLIASHSKALGDAVALGHSLGALAASANERVAEASADGASAVAALAEAIGPGGALTLQLQALHAQYAGSSSAAPASATGAAATPAKASGAL